jgi:hypothetical protein
MSRKIANILYTGNFTGSINPFRQVRFKDWLNLLNIIFFGASFNLTSEVNQLALWKEF